MGKTYWECSKEEVLSQFSVTEQGLSGKQVEEIRVEKGENILQEEKKKSIWQIFMGQFADLLVVILADRSRDFDVFRQCREYAGYFTCTCHECSAWHSAV